MWGRPIEPGMNFWHYVYIIYGKDKHVHGKKDLFFRHPSLIHDVRLGWVRQFPDSPSRFRLPTFGSGLVATYFVSTTYFVLPDLFCINF